MQSQGRGNTLMLDDNVLSSTLYSVVNYDYYLEAGRCIDCGLCCAHGGGPPGGLLSYLDTAICVTIRHAFIRNS